MKGAYRELEGGGDRQIVIAILADVQICKVTELRQVQIEDR